MRALVSTSDKTGLIEFLRPLLSYGLEVISTGGTAEYLKKNQIPVLDVSAVTGFPEVLGGRVKTLHPHVHMGLLADRTNPEHTATLQQHDVKPFDLVVGNLYPFEETALQNDADLHDLIENIDIGGPSFLRASAKNYRSVLVVCDPNDYSWVQEKLISKSISNDDRKKLAVKVFSLTSYYDALIVNRLGGDFEQLSYLNLPLKKKQKMRYGENPQQSAVWYENPLENKTSLATAVQLQGKDLSYNNILDLDASIQLVRQFSDPACVAVKHNNPCGAAIAEDITEACRKCIDADPKSIFGGIIAVNRILDSSSARQFKDIFLECIIAPGFTDEALTILQTKKNLRLLKHAHLTQAQDFGGYQAKSVRGGLLYQSEDSYQNSEWKQKYISYGEPKLREYDFAEKVAGSLKSNAIAVINGTQTAGLGMGQVNRVDAVRQALQRLDDYCQRIEGVNRSALVLASDAFFPFADSIELIAAAGIKNILQPGGSLQDAAVIEAAKKHSINMILTGQRHFKH